MTVNNAENSIDNALVNQIAKLQRDFDEFKSTPQPIGNGSINYAIFGATTVGPVTVTAGSQISVGILFLGPPITWLGLPAITRISFLDFMYSVSVDANDTSAHVFPYGASLTSGQKNMRTSSWCDLFKSGISEFNGQRSVYVQVVNQDSVSHDYYVSMNAVIPRPALKPQ